MERFAATARATTADDRAAAEGDLSGDDGDAAETAEVVGHIVITQDGEEAAAGTADPAAVTGKNKGRLVAFQNKSAARLVANF